MDISKLTLYGVATQTGTSISKLTLYGVVTREFYARLSSTYEIKKREVWSTALEWVPPEGSSGRSDGWGNYTGRMRVQPRALSGKAFAIRLTAQSRSDQSMSLSEVFLGVGFGEGSGSQPSYTEDPVRVTWGGSNGFTIPQATEIVSDPIPFEYDSEWDLALIIGFYLSGTTNQNFVAITPLDGAETWSKAGRDLETITVSGYSRGLRQGVAFVKIEFLDEDNSVIATIESDYSIDNAIMAQLVSDFAVRGTFEASMPSDYSIQGQPFEVSLESDYELGDASFRVLLPSDYVIHDFVTNRVFSEYSILAPVVASLTSAYSIMGDEFEAQLSSSYELLGSITATLVSEYRIEDDNDIRAEMTSSYEIDAPPVASVGTLNLYPMEPVREGWSWLTRVNIAWDSTEQRIAMRVDPRILISQPVALPDERDRMDAYQQLYNVVGTMPYLPMFSYLTRLMGVTPVGSAELFFDREQTWVQLGDQVAIYHPATRRLFEATVQLLTPTGAILSNSFEFELDGSWEVAPCLKVRLPNLSSLSMEALTGRYTLSGEQCAYRRFRRDGSPGTLPMFEDVPVLPTRPIAVKSIEERFDSNSETLDNETGLPATYSSFSHPFVDGTSEWLINRDTDMDFWRDFLWSLRGQQGIFLMSTWREDLELIDVQSDHVIVAGKEYRDKFEYEVYKCLQLESENSVTWRRVLSVVDEGDNLRLNLSSALSDLEVHTLSYLNRVRLNSDVIYFDHYRNHSTVSLPIRTVNE